MGTILKKVKNLLEAIILSDIKHFARRIRWYIQRAKRGYADCDLWSIDSWIARVLIKGLKQFDRQRYGYPADMTDREWSEIINTMIEGFEATLKLNNVCDKEEYKKVKAKQDKGLKLFVKYFNNLWD